MEQPTLKKLFSYPSDAELIKIFPEAKAIIPQKINEWLRIKEKILAKQVYPFLKKLNLLEREGKLDSFSKWFWIEAFKVMVDRRFIEACNQLERLKRLQFLVRDRSYLKKTMHMAQAKEIAKQMSILQFYSFERLRRTGERYTALCPFHQEKTPSFVIYPDNTFHCFGCGVAGDSIEFVKRIKQCDFKEAIGMMAGVRL